MHVTVTPAVRLDAHIVGEGNSGSVSLPARLLISMDVDEAHAFKRVLTNSLANLVAMRDMRIDDLRDRPEIDPDPLSSANWDKDLADLRQAVDYLVQLKNMIPD